MIKYFQKKQYLKYSPENTKKISYTFSDRYITINTNNKYNELFSSKNRRFDLTLHITAMNLWRYTKESPVIFLQDSNLLNLIIQFVNILVSADMQEWQYAN